jgi:hypothetical protein
MGKNDCSFLIRRISKTRGDVSVESCKVGQSFESCSQSFSTNSEELNKLSYFTLLPGMNACKYYEYENLNWYGPYYKNGLVQEGFYCSDLPICRSYAASLMTMASLAILTSLIIINELI